MKLVAPAQPPHAAWYEQPAARVAIGGTAAVGIGVTAGLAMGWRPRKYVHQIAFVLRNPTHPWIGCAALDAARAARVVTQQRFGAGNHIDEAGDAFRHAYGASLLQLAALQRGMPEAEAGRLVEAAGLAHELDGVDNARPNSMTMDLFNNHAGVALTGNGRDGNGAWRTHAQLAQDVVRSLSQGGLRMLDEHGAVVPSKLPPGAG